MTEPHAVRWAQRKIKTAPHLGDWDWTKWHYTLDADFTICSRLIPIALEEGTTFPDTDDDPSRVDCKTCRRMMANRNG